MEVLKEVKERGKFPFLGVAVREPVQLKTSRRALVKGCTGISVKNPDTQLEKTLLISSLKNVAQANGGKAATSC